MPSSSAKFKRTDDVSNTKRGLRAAERAVAGHVWRRGAEAGAIVAVVVGRAQHVEQAFERREVAGHGGGERLLHVVIARDERGIVAAHEGFHLVARLRRARVAGGPASAARARRTA